MDGAGRTDGLSLRAAAGEREPAPAFLGVTRSARGRRWRGRLDAPAQRLALAMSQRHGVPEILGRVLAARGVTLEGVPDALDPTLRALMPDPATLRDMDAAARRLATAILEREPVAVFGDYDVDGACSSALLARFLAHYGLTPRLYIPDRIFEGYGPNTAAMEALMTAGARLIVTVDCGTTSFEPLAFAAGRGADVVVLDHHQTGAELPQAAAVVNPNRQDDTSGQGHLCAAGVTFLTLIATRRELRRRDPSLSEPDLLGLLDLVALATVCDVVPLQGLNRAYTVRGLGILRQWRNTGLKALAAAAGLDRPPTPYHLGFVLGPRINAGGRIGDAGLGARLLATDDPDEAQRIATVLDRLNRERKTVETQILEEAVAAAERAVADDPSLPAVVVGSEGWHKGVVGLVASRLAERFGRPACVIAWDGNGEGTASLRSIPGVDIGRAVRSAVEAGHLIKGGGHAMAAGLTVARSRFEALCAFFTEELGAATESALAAADFGIDGALLAGGATPELAALLEKAGPYGQGNPQPRFAFPAHRVRYAKVLGEAHVRCVLEAADGSRLDAVAFRAAGQPLGDLLTSAAGQPLHVAGHLRVDAWGGRERVELAIEDAAEL